MTERDFAVEVVRTLQAAGHEALFAGGCVRDELLGLVPVDYDVAASATPEHVQRLFRRTVAVGAAFGVVEVIGPKDAAGRHLKVQVATFRNDGAYTDGRRPDAVTFASPQEDAARRDFTVNALFRDPVTGEVRDYVGGRADLDARMLRAVGDPAARFREDKLRLLRAVRMAARFGLAVEPATLAAVRAMAPELPVVSAERIADELRKLLAHPTRAAGVALLRETGLLAVAIPEAAAGPADVQARVLGELRPAAGFPLAFAALHIGTTPAAMPWIARRLKLSNDEAERVGWLVTNRRALVGAEGRPPSRLYPVLAHPGAADLVALHQADGSDPAGVARCEHLLLTRTPADLDPPPLVTGDGLRAAGHRPGPGFKPALAAARAAQLDGLANTPADALRVAVEHLRGDATAG